MSDKITIGALYDEAAQATVNHNFTLSRNDVLDLHAEYEGLRAQLQEYKEALAMSVKQLGDLKADRIQK